MNWPILFYTQILLLIWVKTTKIQRKKIQTKYNCPPQSRSTGKLLFPRKLIYSLTLYVVATIYK